MLTQDLHFHYLLGKHASERQHHIGVWPRETPPHSLCNEVSFFPTLTASPLPFLTGRGTVSFLQICQNDLLFWPPTLPPRSISPDHSDLTINSVSVLTARGLTPEEREEGLLSCHGGQSQQKVLKLGDRVSSKGIGFKP